MALPALAAAAPYAIAGVQALGQLASGAIKKRQANQMALPEQDPTQLAMLDEINRKRRQLEMGAGAEYDLLRKQVGQAQAQTQQNVLRAAGGSGGAAIQGINMAQQGAGMAYAQGSMPLVQKSTQYQQLAQQMVNDIAQRKFEVQQWEKIQKMREAAEQAQAGMQNLFPAAFGAVNAMSSGGLSDVLKKYTNPQGFPVATPPNTPQATQVNTVPSYRNLVPYANINTTPSEPGAFMFQTGIPRID